MEKLVLFTVTDLAKVTNHRSGESKFGETMLTVPKDADPATFLASCSARYVLFGIPEDIGVRANFGRPGAASSWRSAIKAIANIQQNKYCKGYNILVLGTLDVSAEMEAVKTLDFHNTADRQQLNESVARIDKEVCHIISTIVKAGKIPIVIGGGHNNAYGNLKGASLAKGQPLNAVNFDAHSDFRILEGRHSGNGFSYAFEEGFLDHYFIFGLHENYTSKKVLKTLKKREDDRVRFNTYEEIKIRGEKDMATEMQTAFDYVSHKPFGIEIDLDAIPGVASSAMTISGFSVEEVRRFLYFFGKSEHATYLHICEGAPDLAEEKTAHLIGKLIGYLVTDFLKANMPPEIEPEESA